MAALLNWYRLYPEFANNDLYVSGESYAGIYVPYLSWQIHQNNQLAKVNSTYTALPFKGFIVGNGATNWETDIS